MVFNHQWNLPMEIMPSNFGIGSFFCPNKVQISPDALRMRCRRLCTKTSAGKFNVDPSLAKQYSEGGEGREALQMALLEAIAKNGVERSAYKRVKVGYICDFFQSLMTCKSIYHYTIWYIRFSVHNPANVFPQPASRKTSWQNVASYGRDWRAERRKRWGVG